jgi:hypothetical protein
MSREAIAVRRRAEREGKAFESIKICGRWPLPTEFLQSELKIMISKNANI